MASGGGASLDPADPLSREPFLAIADLDYGKDALEGRVRLAAPLSLATIERAFGNRIETGDRVGWDVRSRTVTAVRERRLGALALDRQPLAAPDPAAVTTALLEGIRREGLGALPWTDAARSLQSRVAFLARLDADSGWPDLSDPHLLATLDEWLGPYLAGISRLDALAALDLVAILGGGMGRDQRQALDRLAPETLEAPSGRRVAIDYSDEGGPTAHVRLQEMFGLKETPRLAGGRVNLRFSLLSPAQRPVAITQDIAAFWRGGYLDVRRDLRGRYPKHAWPEDPAGAAPVRPNRPR
jgi:ATP-dependent helicase HrpB